MATIGSAQAKTHLAALLERVSRGERITITKHKVPVALLVPCDPVRQRNRPSVIEELKQFSHGRKLQGTTIRKLIDEGR